MAKKIFLACPNAERLDAMTGFFKKNSFEVGSAQKGPDALQKLSVMEPAPGIVVLSAELPEMNALEICKQLKGNPKYKGVTFLVMLPENWEEAPYREAGITEFIDEECNNDRLLRRVNVLLSYGKAEKKTSAKFVPLLVIGGVVLLFIFFLMKILASLK